MIVRRVYQIRPLKAKVSSELAPTRLGYLEAFGAELLSWPMLNEACPVGCSPAANRSSMDPPTSVQEFVSLLSCCWLLLFPVRSRAQHGQFVQSCRPPNEKFSWYGFQLAATHGFWMNILHQRGKNRSVPNQKEEFAGRIDWVVTQTICSIHNQSSSALLRTAKSEVMPCFTITSGVFLGRYEYIRGPQVLCSDAG